MSQSEDIFRVLYEENAGHLRHFFARRGAAPEEANDLLQDTFLRAYASLNKGTVRKPGREWLFTIATNVWRNRIRWKNAAKRRGREIGLDELPVEQEPSYAPLQSDSFLRTEIFSEPLYEGPHSPVALKVLQSDLLVLDDELIRYLKAHPEKMRELSARKFEELVASLLEDLGYGVELTSRGSDGGVDIFATQKNELGEALVIVDCKRYSVDNRVGVGVVRALYGLSESLRATKALLATTSFFTQPALAFEAQVPYRLGLRDYNALVHWINSYGKNPR